MRHFNLTDSEPASHVEILDEAARSCSVPFRARAADRARTIEFRHVDRYYGALNVTQTCLDNFHGYRSAAAARKDTEPRLVLTVSAGPYAIEQNGRVDRRRSESMVPYWSLANFRLQADERIVARSVTLPVAALGLPYLFLRDLMVRDVSASPLGALVRRYLSELAELPELSQEQAAALAHPTIDLVRAMLTTAGGDEFLSRHPLRQTLGIRIMLYLRSHLADAQLNADKVAAHFGISKRYLYAVLAGMDVTLGEWIKAERLGRAARELANPSNAVVPIAAVATRCGFRDHSVFSRAFRQRYGCTPSEWRLLDDTDRQARQTPSASLPEIAEASLDART